MFKFLVALLLTVPLASAQPVLKGANINYAAAIPNYNVDYKTANAVRLQVISYPGPNYYTDSIIRSARVQQLLDTTNLTIILDLFHWPPNGFCGTKACSFSFNQLIGHWLVVADQYKNNPRVIFNIMNEPPLTQKLTDDLNRRAVKEFRKAGINNVLTICPAHCNPYNLRYMKYHGDAKTWIQVHVYDPFSFTHQGVYDRPTPVYYSDAVRNRLQQVLSLIKQHQTKINRPILLGEFAASTFTPAGDRNRWYSAVYTAIRYNRWHSTFHSYEEAQVWSPAEITSITKYLNE